MNSNSPFLLQTLAGSIIKSLLPAAVRKNSFIINDIPKSFVIDADEQIIASLLNAFIEEGIMNSCNNCIRIGANFSGNFVVLYIKETNHSSSYNQLQNFQSQIEKVGGHIGIAYEKGNITTLTLCFQQQLVAA